MLKRWKYLLLGVIIFSDAIGSTSIEIQAEEIASEESTENQSGNFLTEIMAESFRHLGEPYSYDLTVGVDCSGLVQKALVAIGQSAERYAYEQWYEFKNS